MSKEKRKKVGFNMYPLDWWSSETFFNIDDEALRYRFLEMMFLIYNEGGFWAQNKAYFEKRFRRVLTPQEWGQLASLYIVETLADGVVYWHHDGISKRLDISPAQVIANRTNGSRRGNPNGSETEAKLNPIDKPKVNGKEPKSTPFKVNQTKPNETEPNTDRYEGSVVLNGSASPKPPIGSPSPLWAVGIRDGSIVREVWKKFADHLEQKLPDMDRKKMLWAWRAYWPYELTGETMKKTQDILDQATDEKLRNGLGSLSFILGDVDESSDAENLQTFADPIMRITYLTQ